VYLFIRLHGVTSQTAVIFLITFSEPHISHDQVKFLIYMLKMAVAKSYETLVANDPTANTSLILNWLPALNSLVFTFLWRRSWLWTSILSRCSHTWKGTWQALREITTLCASACVPQHLNCWRKWWVLTKLPMNY